MIAYNTEYVSRILGFRNTIASIGLYWMGPHRKGRKRLKEYFEEEDKSKPLGISSALQSISLNSKKKFQPGSPASTFYDAYCVENSGP